MAIKLTTGSLGIGSLRFNKGVAGGSYTSFAARFDGTNDYLNHPATMTGLVDADHCTLSFWVKFMGGDGTDQMVMSIYNGGAAHLLVRRQASNTLRFWGRSAGTVVQIDMSGDSLITVASGWVHVLIVVNTNVQADCKIYVNGVPDTITMATLDSSSTIFFTAPHVTIGARASGADQRLNAELSEVWMDSGVAQYHDVPTDFASGGKPVDLGADGSGPTGVQPAIYLRDPHTSFETNYGEGANFTVVGALTEGTPP